MESPEDINSWRQRLQDVVKWFRDFIYGMTYYEMELRLRRDRADLEHLFVLISFGDLLGIPILPPITPCACCRLSCRSWKIGVAGCCAKRI